MRAVSATLKSALKNQNFTIDFCLHIPIRSKDRLTVAKIHLPGWILNFLSHIVEIIPAVVGPQAGVECGGNVAHRRRTTGEVGLL